MNFLKKGPEIKLPSKLSDVKVPGFLQDAYYELNERHLLPLVVVLIAAIVAVPIALSESSDTGAASVPVEAGAQASAQGQVVVSKSLPGLRDYQERLKGLKAKDPFKQQFTDVERSGTPIEEEAATPESSEGEGGGGETGGSSSPAPGGGGTGELKYFSWSVDVRVVPVSTNGKPSQAKPTVRRNQPELTMLPGRQTPAVIFIGPSSDHQKAMMLVSSNVTAVFGDAICVLGGETCEMVALEKGVPETFVYGGNQRIFRIELLKIRLVETDKLNKAPLGKPKTGSRPQAQNQVAAVERAVRR